MNVSAAFVAVALNLTGFAGRLPPVRVRGLATVFYAQETHNNGVLACKSVAIKARGHNRHVDSLPIIAMRPGEGPPCGTWVIVENVRTGLATYARLEETGPWGCWKDTERRVLGNAACHTWGGKRRAPGQPARYIADLSKAVCDAIDCDGKDPVRIRW